MTVALLLLTVLLLASGAGFYHEGSRLAREELTERERDQAAIRALAYAFAAAGVGAVCIVLALA